MAKRPENDVNPVEVTPTRLELQRAWAIRQAARADSTIDDEALSDWECLQHSIVAKDAIGLALTRIRRLQAFKERYGILRDGSVDEARRDLHVFLQTHPGFYLSLAQGIVGESKKKTVASSSSAPPSKVVSSGDTPPSHTISPSQPKPTCSTASSSALNTTEAQSVSSPLPAQIRCYSYRDFCARRMTTDEALAIYMRAAFYVLNASQHTLTALRGGLVTYIDCSGMLSRVNYAPAVEKEARQLFMGAYPIRMQHIGMLNVFPLMRWLYHLVAKPFLNPKIVALLRMDSDRDAVLAATAAAHPSASFYKVLPVTWGGRCAVEDFAKTILVRLQQREENVQNFQLVEPTEWGQ